MILEEEVEAPHMLTGGCYHICLFPLKGVHLVMMEASNCIVAPSFMWLKGYEWKGTSLGSLALPEAFKATLVSCASPKPCLYPLGNWRYTTLWNSLPWIWTWFQVWLTPCCLLEAFMHKSPLRIFSILWEFKETITLWYQCKLNVKWWNIWGI